MRISDWSSDVCSSDLSGKAGCGSNDFCRRGKATPIPLPHGPTIGQWQPAPDPISAPVAPCRPFLARSGKAGQLQWPCGATKQAHRSEEHTSELQSLMRNSYAVFCLKKKKNYNTQKIP